MVFKGEDVPDYEALGFERLDEMNTLVSACLDDPYAIGYSIMTYMNDVYSNEALHAFSLNGYSATPEMFCTGDYPLWHEGLCHHGSDEPEDSTAPGGSITGLVPPWIHPSAGSGIAPAGAIYDLLTMQKQQLQK